MVIESFRAGTFEQWNLGEERLRALSPGLVMVRVSGFGQTGPLSHIAGHDLVIPAATGVLGCLNNGWTGSYRLAGRDVSKLKADELAELRRRPSQPRDVAPTLLDLPWYPIGMWTLWL